MSKKNIVVFGATSAIAEQFARHEAPGARLYLVGRSPESLQVIADDLVVRGATVKSGILDVADFQQHAKVLDVAIAWLGSVDVILIAHGTLPDQSKCEQDVATALQGFSINATATISLMTLAAQRLQAQGSGTLAVISSVAGDRGRSSNYLYGSAKAAVSAFASGLRQRLHGTGVNVLTVKPGFVDTPMTRDFNKGPLWASARAVGVGIARAIDRRRSVAYLPGFWWAIMRVITHVPEPLFRRLKF